MENHLDEMVALVSGTPRRRIVGDDIVRWSGSLSNNAFYNSTSLAVALKYQEGTLDFPICDAIMNDLWSVLIENLHGRMVPSPFFDIYEAFDAGEYYRTKDKSDFPEEKFTKPMIDAILSKTPRS